VNEIQYMKQVLLASFIGILIISASCSKNGTGSSGSIECSTVSKSFVADVDPIIQGRCNLASCHGAGSTNGPGPLTNYNEVFNARTRIRAAVNAGLMPQGSTLSASQKNSLICWIDSGAPNN
jgi:hypothetical protein